MPNMSVPDVSVGVAAFHAAAFTFAAAAPYAESFIMVECVGEAFISDWAA
jgi:hypothetical protein